MAPSATVAALVLGALPRLARGHAYITQPAMRGGAFNNAGNAFCPQCLGSTSLPLPTCGQTKFLDVEGPVSELRAGAMAEFKITITLPTTRGTSSSGCATATSTASRAASRPRRRASTSTSSGAQGPRRCTRTAGPTTGGATAGPYDEANPGYWYLPPPGDSEYSFHYWIPANLTCQHCTLQWWWMSANSCTPHQDAYTCYFAEMARQGWSAGEWWGQAKANANCPANQGPPRDCGEQFKNCADVRVLDGSGTFAPTPPPSPTPPPTSAPTNAPGSRCVHQTDCTVSAWCRDQTYVSWCPVRPVDDCPSPQCVVSGGSPMPQTTAPTVAPTTAPPMPTTRQPTTMAPTMVPPMPTTRPPTTMTPTTAPRMSCDVCSGMFPQHPCIWSDDACVPVTQQYCGVILGTTWCGSAPTTPTPAPTVSSPCAQCEMGSACLWSDGMCYRVARSTCEYHQGTWCGDESLVESGRAKLKRQHAFLGLLQESARLHSEEL